MERYTNDLAEVFRQIRNAANADTSGLELVDWAIDVADQSQRAALSEDQISECNQKTYRRLIENLANSAYSTVLRMGRGAYIAGVDEYGLIGDFHYLYSSEIYDKVPDLARLIRRYNAATEAIVCLDYGDGESEINLLKFHEKPSLEDIRTVDLGSWHHPHIGNVPFMLRCIGGSADRYVKDSTAAYLCHPKQIGITLPSSTTLLEPLPGVQQVFVFLCPAFIPPKVVFRAMVELMHVFIAADRSPEFEFLQHLVGGPILPLQMVDLGWLAEELQQLLRTNYERRARRVEPASKWVMTDAAIRLDEV